MPRAADPRARPAASPPRAARARARAPAASSWEVRELVRADEEDGCPRAAAAPRGSRRCGRDGRARPPLSGTSSNASRVSSSRASGPASSSACVPGPRRRGRGAGRGRSGRSQPGRARDGRRAADRRRLRGSLLVPLELLVADLDGRRRASRRLRGAPPRARPAEAACRRRDSRGRSGGCETAALGASLRPILEELREHVPFRRHGARDRAELEQRALQLARSLRRWRTRSRRRRRCAVVLEGEAPAAWSRRSTLFRTTSCGRSSRPAPYAASSRSIVREPPLEILLRRRRGRGRGGAHARGGRGTRGRGRRPPPRPRSRPGTSATVSCLVASGPRRCRGRARSW